MQPTMKHPRYLQHHCPWSSGPAAGPEKTHTHYSAYVKVILVTIVNFDTGHTHYSLHDQVTTDPLSYNLIQVSLHYSACVKVIIASIIIKV